MLRALYAYISSLNLVGIGRRTPAVEEKFDVLKYVCFFTFSLVKHWADWSYSCPDDGVRKTMRLSAL